MPEMRRIEFLQPFPVAITTMILRIRTNTLYCSLHAIFWGDADDAD